MRRFALLYEALDATTSTRAKVAALRAYFSQADPADAAWALFFLTGGRLKRIVAPRLLARWGCAHAGIAPWLFDECLALAGDLAETLSLLFDAQRPGQAPAAEQVPPLARLVEEMLLPLREAGEEEKRAAVERLWDALPRRELFLLGKLLTGELRVGVSSTLTARALAEHAGLPRATLAHRLMGSWRPSAQAFAALLRPGAPEEDASRPYPFFLASPLEQPPEQLGEAGAWLVEWKWDGIRAQIVRRGGGAFLWSRGEELVTDRFPELSAVWAALPDGTVLDGELLAFAQGRPLPFSVLQRRIARQKLSQAILAEAPAAFMAFDALELDAADLRGLPLQERRERLAALLAGRGPRLLLSEQVPAGDWAQLRALRAQSREQGVEGLMLKRLQSPYRVGRPRGDWFKWKIDPYAIDAVLVYAQPGHGRRATLLTDLTFAVWSGGELLPVAKAYSGLSDAEIDALDRWIRQHTVERFGPVRAVEPLQVFELHFEGIAPSARHKGGVAVRFPRIARWRADKKPVDADTLEALRALVPASG